MSDDAHQSSTKRLLNRLRSGGAWVIIGRTVGMATVLGSFMFLARATDKANFAAYVLASSIVSLFSMAAMFGLNTLVCRFISESFGTGDAVRAGKAVRYVATISAVSISVVAAVAWFALRYFAAEIFSMPVLSEYAGLITVWIVLLAISQLIAEAFRGLHDLRMAGMLAGVSGGLVASLFFLIGMFVASFFMTITFGTIVVGSVAALLLACLGSAAYFASVFASQRANPPEPETEGEQQELEPLTLFSVVNEAVPVVLTQVCGYGMSQLDIWIVGMCLSDSDVAIYGVARRLSLLIAVPLTQLSLAISSSIAELHAQGDKPNLQRVVKATATVSAIASGLPTIVLIAFAGVALGMIFEPSYAEGANTLRILLIGQIIFAFTGPCGPALMMTGHQRVSLWSLLGVLPLFALAPYAARHFGLEGIAVVFSVVLGLQNLIQWILVGRLLGISTQPCFSPGYLYRLIRA